MFWINNKKNRCTPEDPIFSLIIKVGYKGVYITCHGHVFLIRISNTKLSVAEQVGFSFLVWLFT